MDNEEFYVFLPLMVCSRPDAQHSEADKTSWERVLRPIIFTQPATDTQLLAYVHLCFNDKFIFLPEQEIYFLDFASKMLSRRRARAKKEKSTQKIFHREEIMERNNTERERIDNSLEGDTMLWWMQSEHGNKKKSPAKF